MRKMQLVQTAKHYDKAHHLNGEELIKMYMCLAYTDLLRQYAMSVIDEGLEKIQRSDV